MTDHRHLIFISYRGSDVNWATELVYARLTEAFGADAVFKAGNSLRPGEKFPAILRKQAASCPVMLVCIGPNWLNASASKGRDLDRPDDWVRQEIAISLRAGNDVIPLLMGNHGEVAIPSADRLPEEIRDLVDNQAWRIAPGGGLDLTMPKLVARLTALVPELAEHQIGAASPSADASERNPDRGSGGTATMTNIVFDQGRIIATQSGDTHIHSDTDQ